jgi:chaperonin GroEL
MLQDVAILTGGTVITEELGRKLETVTINDLGKAGKVVATKDDTTIIEGSGDAAKIKGRIEEIKVEIDKSTSDYDKEKLQERLAKLSGGVALVNAMEALKDLKLEFDDETVGVAIVRRSLEVPLRKISENAGQDGAVVMETVRRTQTEKKNKNIGYDVLSGEYVDMVKGGIIDPAKVTKGALENAASIAAMILTTEALITDVPERDKPAPPQMPEY